VPVLCTTLSSLCSPLLSNGSLHGCCCCWCSATYFSTTRDKWQKYWKHSSRKTRFGYVAVEFSFGFFSLACEAVNSVVGTLLKVVLSVVCCENFRCVSYCCIYIRKQVFDDTLQLILWFLLIHYHMWWQSSDIHNIAQINTGKEHFMRCYMSDILSSKMGTTHFLASSDFGMADVIFLAKFKLSRFRGFSLMLAKNHPSPLTCAVALYNSVTLWKLHYMFSKQMWSIVCRRMLCC